MLICLFSSVYTNCFRLTYFMAISINYGLIKNKINCRGYSYRAREKTWVQGCQSGFRLNCLKYIIKIINFIAHSVWITPLKLFGKERVFLPKMHRFEFKNQIQGLILSSSEGRTNFWELLFLWGFYTKIGPDSHRQLSPLSWTHLTPVAKFSLFWIVAVIFAAFPFPQTDPNQSYACGFSSARNWSFTLGHFCRLDKLSQETSFVFARVVTEVFVDRVLYGSAIFEQSQNKTFIKHGLNSSVPFWKQFGNCI